MKMKKTKKILAVLMSMIVIMGVCGVGTGCDPNKETEAEYKARIKKELDEIISETRQDEEKLYTKAKAIESKIDDERLLQAFKRIRRNARNGLGVVTVERNACGGCFNRIPAQRQMEIKMHKKIIVCEYCGRIMIDPELAGIEEN